MKKSEKYIRVDEVMTILEVNKSTAYKKIGELNEELKQQGFITVKGKCPREFFYQKLYGYKEANHD